MKNYLLFGFLFFAICFTNELVAQVDLKVNPIGILFKNPELAGEISFDENISIEAAAGLKYGGLDFLGANFESKGYSFRVSPRYYFNPEMGTDNFYGGLYARYTAQNFTTSVANLEGDFDRKKLALGFLTGYKWVGNSGVLLDINAGLGRKIINKTTSENFNEVELNSLPLINIDLLATIAIGYRIGK